MHKLKYQKDCLSKGHLLSVKKGKETIKNIKRNYTDKFHSHSIKCSGRDKSKHRKKLYGQGHLHPIKCRKRDKLRHWKQLSRQETLTSCYTWIECQVRTPKKTIWQRGTYKLLDKKREISQNTKRNHAGKGHSLPVKHRKDRSE
jgi:hypothetical protein